MELIPAPYYAVRIKDGKPCIQSDVGYAISERDANGVQYIRFPERSPLATIRDQYAYGNEVHTTAEAAALAAARAYDRLCEAQALYEKTSHE